MKETEKQINTAECKPSGILDFFENLVRTKKHEFIKEQENNQFSIGDYSLENGFLSGDRVKSAEDFRNKPIYRIKIRMRE